MSATPSFQIRRIDRLECAGLAHAVGAELIRAEMVGSRVSFVFQLDRPQLDAVLQFQRGNGPCIDAAKFNLSLKWARDTCFSVRRENGAE